MSTPETELESQLRRTLREPDGEALVVPDMVERVNAGMARTRRRRQRATITAVLASAALVLGVSVVSSSTGETRSVDTAEAGRTEVPPFPAPPEGSRWVGMNGVVVAVPISWAISESPCGTGSQTEVIDARREATVDCAYDFSKIETQVRLTYVAAAPRPADERVCDASVNGLCVGGAIFEAQDVAVVVHARGPDALDQVEAILASAMVLPDGWTTVPFAEGATLSGRVNLLENAGFKVDVTDAERIDRFDIAVSPGIGAPVEEGSLIELAPLATEQPTENSSGDPTDSASGAGVPDCRAVQISDATATGDELVVRLLNEGETACDLDGLQAAVTLGDFKLRDKAQPADFTASGEELTAGGAAVIRIATYPGCQFAGKEFTLTLGDDASVTVLHPGEIGVDCIQPAPQMELGGVEVAGAESGETRPTDLQLLACPSGRMSVTSGGYLVEAPDGHPTREQAVEAWITGSRFEGQAFQVAENGRYALILRADGSAEAYVEFLINSGYTVYGNSTCSD